MPIKFALIVGGTSLIVAIIRYLIHSYNQLQKLREGIAMSRSGIKIVIDRRSAAVNDLAQVAQAFGRIDQMVNLQVSRDNSLRGMNASYQVSGSYLAQVRNVASEFPTLQSNAHYLELSRSIDEIERQIQLHRNYSNEQVARYNTLRNAFPTVLFAKHMGFHAEEYVELDVENARAAAAPLALHAGEERRLDHVLGGAPAAVAISAPPTPSPGVLMPPTAAPLMLPAPRQEPTPFSSSSSSQSHTLVATSTQAHEQIPATDGRTTYAPVTPSTVLRFTSGPLAGQSLPIGASTIIGREGSVSKLVIPHPQVSSAHAWIGWNGVSLAFIDRGSTNGSSINGTPAAAGAELSLRDGDVVTLGREGAVSFVVEQRSSSH